MTLAHEGEHAWGLKNEKKAECWAIQDVALTAKHLKLGWSYGHRLSELYWEHRYPYSRYWTPKCHEGGPWDIYDGPMWP